MCAATTIYHQLPVDARWGPSIHCAGLPTPTLPLPIPLTQPQPQLLFCGLLPTASALGLGLSAQITILQRGQPHAHPPAVLLGAAGTGSVKLGLGFDRVE